MQKLNEKRVFKLLGKNKGLTEVSESDVCMDDISTQEMMSWAIAGGAFDFLLEDEDLYTEDDVIEPA